MSGIKGHSSKNLYLFIISENKKTMQLIRPFLSSYCVQMSYCKTHWMNGELDEVKKYFEVVVLICSQDQTSFYNDV